MFVYAALVPHPPFLVVPRMAEQKKQILHTVGAYEQVAAELASLRVDTLVCLSVHAERYADALALALHDPFVADVRAFGDLKTTASFSPDLMLVDRLHRALRQAGLGTTLTTNETVDVATSVALLGLRPVADRLRVVVATPPLVDAKQVVRFGEVMREAIETVPQRVAVIAVANLSDRLSGLSEGGVHPKAGAFVESCRHALQDGNSLPLLKPSTKDLQALGAEDLDAVRLLWGLLDSHAYTIQEYGFEAPFGTAYMTAAFHVHA